MADLRRLHPRLTETDLDSAPFVPELSPVVNPHGDGLVTRPWLDWARRLTLLVGVKTGGGGGGGTGDVVGPNGATPDAIAIYSGTTGKLIKDSLKSIGSVINDAVTQAIAAILPGGKLPVSNLPLHKTTHQAGGVDAVDVKLLAGFPANNAVFLNGAGAFTTPTAGVPGAHHLTHEPGGSDPMAVDAAAAVGSLRTLGTGANQAAPGNDARFSTPANHAPRHSAGGADPVTVTNLAGYPGGTTNFLRSDGTFATPTAGVPGPHHATHEVGGSDQLVNAAWTNQPNVFTQPQTIRDASVLLLDTTQAANQRQWKEVVFAGELYLQPTNDAGTASISALLSKRDGSVTVGNNLTALGSGGNVACKDQANTFSQNQTITTNASPALLITDTAQPANAKVFRIMNSAQYLKFTTLDDAGTTAQTQPLWLSRAGDALIGRDVYEKGRTVPVGHWTVDAMSTWVVGFSGAYTYTYIGKTFVLIGYGSGVCSGTTYLRVFMPIVSAASFTIPAMCHLGAPGWVAGVAVFTASVGTFDIYPGGNQVWPNGTGFMSFNLSVPIQ